jgi:polynucleotide 5'-kinase involved in rRNA processing
VEQPLATRQHGNILPRLVHGQTLDAKPRSRKEKKNHRGSHYERRFTGGSL